MQEEKGEGVVLNWILTGLLLLMILPSGVDAAEQTRLRLATTTSTENSGLLAELIPPYENERGVKIDVIAVGTGKAIKLGMAGDVDVVLVHARSKEDKFVDEGYGVDRRDVMYNDFVLLGPASDPADIRGLADVTDAMARVAVTKSTFVSRGDDSGTHSKEISLWNEAGVMPEGAWYLEAGRGMGEVIVMATERGGYTLSDRGTYIAFGNKTDLVALVSGDERLFNPYGAIMVNPERHPHVNEALGRDFLDYLVSDQAKGLITGFRKAGQQLFYVQQ
jgi:tungstate transport system substrate-binding protein